MTQKQKLPAVDGFFTLDDPPHLLGTQCTVCGVYYFPRENVMCRRPQCVSTEFREVELSRRGKIWSYTNACYQPPAPFVAKDPFEPFAIAAVTLEKEGLTILGQVADGLNVDALQTGQSVELTLGTLYEDDDNEYLTWQWKPVSESAGAP